jgi:serine phosphatase RsbU (regulator of sigma subunit)
LLQRERELFELRLKFDQLAAWLSFGQALPEMFLPRGASVEEVWSRLRRTLVAKLRLQRVVLADVHADGLAVLAPGGAQPEVSAEALSLLDAHPWGWCNDPAAPTNVPGVSALAKALGLHQFMWSRIARAGLPAILMAGGFDRARSSFQSPLVENDAAHFRNAAQHVEALLASAVLVDELEREKHQLHQANLTLEQRDQALRQAAGELLAANESLEQRVRDRTQELANRNRELRELPRQIQTSILPKCTTAASITISARMVPAEEVGGDYYDVLPVPDGAWIAVGDVSGHGLRAGLITFMLQSAVSTLTAARPDARPSEIVTLLNSVIYKNIRERLGSDDHVTFVLLRVFEDGRVSFAGGHEELLVRRARTGTCETFRTRGTWLGAIPDIDRATTDTELRLEKGDQLVAYTDGITEARNQAGEVFGIDRLRREVASAGDVSPAEVCDRVWSEVNAWCARPDDDMSLVSIRFEGVEKA